jgi:hypothetical protein
MPQNCSSFVAYARICLGNNFDGRSFGDLVEALCDIRVTHAYAAVAGWSAKQRFLICPVYVDVPVLCVGIAWLIAIEPKNTGQNEVSFTALLGDLASLFAALENGAEGGSGTNFLADEELAEWSFVTAGVSAQPEL